MKYLGRVSRSRFFSGFILLCCAVQLHAGKYRFMHLTTANGLSSNNVTCALTDSRGFTWLGTGSGLNCYDGNQCASFFHDDANPFSIPHDRIFSIHEENTGFLIIATQAGIARFNPWNKKSVVLKISDPKDRYGVCTDCTIDNTGILWCWSQHALYKLNPISGMLDRVIVCDNQNGRPDRMNGFYRDKKGNAWITSFSGLCLLDEKTATTKIDPLNPGAPILVVTAFEDFRNELRLGTWGAGILQYDRTDKSWKTMFWDHDNPFSSATNIVTHYAETKDANGNTQIWASTSNGLVALDDWDEHGDFASMNFIHHRAEDPLSPASDHVGSIYVNRQNQLWVCTDQGASILLPEAQAFQLFAPDLVGSVTQIVRDDYGYAVCTWHGNGFQRINNDGDILPLITFAHLPETATAADNSQISDVCIARDGTHWIATFAGLVHSDKAAQHFSMMPVADSIEPGLPTNHTTCVAESHDGKIWCGTYGKGVSVYDTRSHRFSLYSNATSPLKILPADLIWALLPMKDGTMWIATNDGVACYDGAKMISYEKVAIGSDSVKLTVCTSLYEDTLGNLWVCSDDGLFCKSPAGWKFFNRQSGLPDNNVEDVQEDAAGNLWIATTNGLAVMNQKQEVLARFGTASGLPDASLGILIDADDDKMIVTSGAQLILFSPEQLLTPGLIPTVYLTSVKSGSSVIDLSWDPDRSDSLELEPDQNSIAFEFVSPGIYPGRKIHYQYRLLGSDEAWNDSGDRTVASFAGLGPGSYTFEVRASLANGAWSEVVSYGFTIHPPFWKTWWFISLISVLVLASTVLIVRRESTRRMREQLLRLEKQQAVVQERNRISKDMHDDLGSGLTTIAIMSEVVKQKISSGSDASQQVNTISDSARNLVDNLNEIVWALNPGNDNLQNLVAYMREYATNYLEQFGINLRCNFPDEIPARELSEQSRRFLFLVVKESMHNIVKHAQASEVTLTVSVGVALVIEIRDNGKGFDVDDTREFGNGLKNMQQRMESVNGSYSIASQPGKGTPTQIQLPLP